MTTDALLTHLTVSTLAFSSAFLAVLGGWRRFLAWLGAQEQRYQMVLNQHLLLDIHPRLAMGLTLAAIVGAGAVLGLLLKSPLWFLAGSAAALALPGVVISHLEEKRRHRLDAQITDGITSLVSGVRAGLNLVQSIQLLVRNTTGPLQQEFQQMLREYDLGVDLAQAMNNTSQRIGSSYYRLLFSAIQAHRQRGGNLGESLDRIGQTIREIQRLEGRLRALTAEGRAQARFMGMMPFVIIAIWGALFPQDIELLFTEPFGRFILLVAGVMIFIGFRWIQRIMDVDI